MIIILLINFIEPNTFKIFNIHPYYIVTNSCILINAFIDALVHTLDTVFKF